MRYPAIPFAVLFVMSLAACGGENGSSSGGAGGADEASAGSATGTSGAMNAAEAVDAEGTDGSITATLNGERRTWYIVRKRVGGETRSHSEWATWTPSSRVVTLYGHASPNSIASTRGLMLELNLVVMENTTSVSSASLSYLRGDIPDMYVTQGPMVSGVELESYEQEGDRITVSGTFEATLEPNATGETDGPGKIEVENGNFNATIYKAPEQ